MDLNLLVRRYYDVDPESHDIQFSFDPSYSLEDRLLSDLYCCMDEGIPVEDTVCDMKGVPIYSPEEAEFLFISLQEKLEND